MVDLVISVVYISVIRQAKMNIIREEERIEELAHSVDEFGKGIESVFLQQHISFQSGLLSLIARERESESLSKLVQI